jgi:hypothetical protein
MGAIESRFLKYCLENLDLGQPDQCERYYSSVALCAFDALYSINTKYEAVEKALARFCEHFDLESRYSKKGRIPPIEAQISVSEIYARIRDLRPERLAEDIFINRQRTSPTNGILKADACLRFSKVLVAFRVEYYQDVSNACGNVDFEKSVKGIPGQRSGVSLKYFYMLTGSKNEIKPDRMVLSFITDGTGRNLSCDEALVLVRTTVDALKVKGYDHLNARYLDNLIWNYQRKNMRKGRSLGATCWSGC